MIKHYFQLVWARRKQNLLIGGTLFFAFLVLAFFSSFLISNVLPLWSSQGFKDEGVFFASVKPSKDITDEDAKAAFFQMRRQLETLPGIEQISWTPWMVPYSSVPKSMDIPNGEQVDRVSAFWVDDHFAEVMSLPVYQGRWFSNKDLTSRVPPIVITTEMKDVFFPEKNPIGETLLVDEKPFRVVGVCGDYRNLPDGGITSAIFFWFDPHQSTQAPPRNFLLTYQDGVNPDSLAETIKSMVEEIAIGAEWRLGRAGELKELRTTKMKIYTVSITMAIFVGFILMSNVAVGILGVFWNNVLSRFPEIGIRRAMGSRKRGIYFQIMGEAFALVTLSITPAMLLFIQVPIFKAGMMEWKDCLPGMSFAALFLYLLVGVCSLYPGWLAASLQPTVALHEE